MSNQATAERETKSFTFKGKSIQGEKLRTNLDGRQAWGVKSAKGISGLLYEFECGTLRVVWLPVGKMPRTETQYPA